MDNDGSSASMHTTNGNNSTLMSMAQSHTIKGIGPSKGKLSSFSHSITSYTLLTLRVRVSFQVALLASPVHSSSEALPRFRRGNSGVNPVSQALEYPSNSLGSELRYLPTIGAEQTNIHPYPGTGGINAPPKTPNQPRKTGGREMNDGQEANVTPDHEILDLDGDQASPETGNSGCRVFVGLGDDRSRQAQEMHHWMRSVEN
ncbi:hypothetical protein PIB30_075721 [Stylosanthes scabra]|uniref:Uncharacterized protein n=1 Tax=Stylosanthes scabra TaxID=79078 RepID=A0ABU6UNX0_9FABA|nr:hypothetical protein [Stylosanthes scabra]